MESWISANKTSGQGNDSVNLTTESNPGADRSTSIRVTTNGGAEASVVCSQTGLRHNFNVVSGASNTVFRVSNGSSYEDFLVLKQQI